MDVWKNKATLFKCIEASNACTDEWVDVCSSEELAWNEIPSASFPNRRGGGFVEFHQAAIGELRAFPISSWRW